MIRHNIESKDSLFHIKRPVLLLGAVVVLLFWRFIFLGEIAVPADYLYEQYPWKEGTITPINNTTKTSLDKDPIHTVYLWKKLAFDEIRVGNFPLWNPYSFLGNPLIGGFQSAVFTPFNILHFIFHFPFAYTLALLVKVFFTGLFMLLYLRSLKLHIFPSTLGALTLMLSTYFMIFLEMDIIQNIVVWIPALLLATDRMLKQTSLLWAVPVGLLTAFIVVGGHLQFASYAIGIFFLYSIFRLYRYPSPNRIFLILVSLVLAAMVSAIQWVPAVEAISLGGGRYPHELSGYNFGPRTLILKLVTILVPDFLGSAALYGRWYWDSFTNYEHTLYIGILPLLFVFFSLRCKPNREVYFSFFLLVAFFLFGMTPLYYIPLKLFPGYNLTEDPSRLFFFSFPFLAAILAAYGGMTVESWFNSQINLGFKFIRAIFFLAFSLYVAFYLTLILAKNSILEFGYKFAEENIFGTPHHLDTLAAYHQKIDSTYQMILNNFSPMSPVVWVPLFVLFITCLLFWSREKQWISVGFLKISIIFLVILDLLPIAMRANTFVPENWIYPETKVTNWLKKQGGLGRILALDRVEAGRVEKVFYGNFLMAYRLFNVEGYESVYSKRYHELVTAIDAGPENYTKKLFTNRVNIKNYHSPILDLLGVRYMISRIPLDDSKLELVYDDEVKVYKNINALPRAFLVKDVIGEKNDIDTLRKMFSPNFNLREKALIYPETRKASLDMPMPGIDKVEIMEYLPGNISIYTKTKSPAFLVLSEAYYPGWVVRIDRQPGEILRTDYMLMGVYIEPGKHILKFSYEPLSFRIGLWLTIIGLIATVAISGLCLLKHGREKKPNCNTV